MHIKSARCALEQRLGRAPLLSELAAETGLTPEEIAFAETATNPAESLQRETGEDGFTLEHVLCDTEGEERMIEHVALRCAIEELPEKERKTLYLRYYHGFTQESATWQAVAETRAIRDAEPACEQHEADQQQQHPDATGDAVEDHVELGGQQRIARPSEQRGGEQGRKDQAEEGGK